MNTQRFHQTLQKHSPGQALTEADASEALRNLTGFLDVLIAINKRRGLVPMAAEQPPPTPPKRKRGSHAG